MTANVGTQAAPTVMLRGNVAMTPLDSAGCVRHVLSMWPTNSKIPTRRRTARTDRHNPLHFHRPTTRSARLLSPKIRHAPRIQSACTTGSEFVSFPI